MKRSLRPTFAVQSRQSWQRAEEELTLREKDRRRVEEVEGLHRLQSLYTGEV